MQNANAQFNVATGFTNTAIINGSCYRLTNQGETSATGVVWSISTLDLTCNFIKAYNVKFGKDYLTGTDAIIFKSDVAK